MAARPSASTRALAVARAAGVAVEVLPYPAEGKVAGDEVARLLHLDPARVLKTLVTDAGGELVVALVAVCDQLDGRALARHLGVRRVALADRRVAERVTGYRVGAISPLGQRRRLRTVVDDRVRAVERVYVSAGAHGLEMGIALDDLLRLTGADTAAIATRRDA